MKNRLAPRMHEASQAAFEDRYIVTTRQTSIENEGLLGLAV